MPRGAGGPPGAARSGVGVRGWEPPGMELGAGAPPGKSQGSNEKTAGTDQTSLNFGRFLLWSKVRNGRPDKCLGCTGFLFENLWCSRSLPPQRVRLSECRLSRLVLHCLGLCSIARCVGMGHVSLAGSVLVCRKRFQICCRLVCFVWIIGRGRPSGPSASTRSSPCGVRSARGKLTAKLPTADCWVISNGGLVFWLALTPSASPPPRPKDASCGLEGCKVASCKAGLKCTCGLEGCKAVSFGLNGCKAASWGL